MSCRPAHGQSGASGRPRPKGREELPPLSVLYPTLSTMLEGTDRCPDTGSFYHRGNLAAALPRQVMCDALPRHGGKLGSVSHAKVVLAIPPSLIDSGCAATDRDWDKGRGRLCGVVCLGSANMSESAWGTLYTPKTKSAWLKGNNFELNILIPATSVAQAREFVERCPVWMPGPKYSGSDQPYTLNSAFYEPAGPGGAQKALRSKREQWERSADQREYRERVRVWLSTGRFNNHEFKHDFEIPVVDLT